MSMHLVTPAEKGICSFAHTHLTLPGQECWEYIVVLAGLGKAESLEAGRSRNAKGHSGKRRVTGAEGETGGLEVAAHQRCQGCRQVQEAVGSQGSLDWQC